MHVSSFIMILFRQRTTKVLIRLHSRCSSTTKSDFSRLSPFIVFYDVKDNLPSILALGNDEAFVLNTNTNTMIASYLPLLSIEI